MLSTVTYPLPSLLGLIMAPCVGDADTIFLPCGFFFLLLSSVFFFPHLISAVVHVCHTSTHDVALVRI